MESLEAKAMKDGCSACVHGPIYLHDYNISPGVQLWSLGERVLFGLRLQVHKGDHDDVIEWPFDYKIRCTLVHPATNEEKVVICKTNRDFEDKKPANLSNRGVCFHNYFNLGDLKTDGYVRHDKVRVVVELF